MLVPVAVYWGRAPQREHVSWFRLLFSEDWALASSLRRALAVLLQRPQHGGGVRSTGVSLRSLVAEGTADNQAARRMIRHLNGQLVASRTAYVGPGPFAPPHADDRSAARPRRCARWWRRKPVDKKHPAAPGAAAGHAKCSTRSPPTTRTSSCASWSACCAGCWTRIYDGVDVAHAETIAAVAAGNELVYVPCHRSTMDDLLMPYAIYSHGFAVPHIAAGINLNLPVVGPHAAQGRRLLHAPQLPWQRRCTRPCS